MVGNLVQCHLWQVHRKSHLRPKVQPFHEAA
jgi:hypothetical protein